MITIIFLALVDLLLYSLNPFFGYLALVLEFSVAGTYLMLWIDARTTQK
jgi:hypothetical protein